jgi:hypothetical protein
MRITVIIIITVMFDATPGRATGVLKPGFSGIAGRIALGRFKTNSVRRRWSSCGGVTCEA